MVFDQIEALKRNYTDKYVVVDESVPELRRFHGQTGVVKTVNMSGRALVQFDAYANIGWYDIDVSFLRVIDQPLPKAEPKAKSAAASKPEAVAKAKEPAVKTASSGTGSPNMADILAAARANKGAASTPAPSPTKAAAGKTAAQSPSSTAAGPAKLNPAGMSVADILAAARSNKEGGTSATAKAPPAKSEPVAKVPPVAKAESVPESAPVVEPSPTPKVSSPVAGTKKDVPKTTAEIVAYCRRTDAHA